MKDNVLEKDAALVVNNVAKTYSTQAELLPVLIDISFSLDRGTSLSIIGESGTGKSTLLNLIGGLDYTSNGSIKIFDTQIEDLCETELAIFRNKNIGFVFQYHHLLPDFTALENAMFPALIAGADRAKAEEQAVSMLKTAGLYNRLQHRPFQLSGGEQQRVAIVRSLVNHQKFVLMDEPTGNLDEKTGDGILDMIWELKEKYSLNIILVTHNHSIAAQTDYCYKLSSGYGEFIKL